MSWMPARCDSLYRGLLRSCVFLAIGLLGDRVHGESFRLGTFVVDITPKLGSPLCAGAVKPLEGIDDPLLGKGLVLEAGQRRYVLCALDWCEVLSGSHTWVRQQLAAATRTQAEFVAVQCLHQHNAPIVDEEAQKLLDATGKSVPLVDVASFHEAIDRLAAAAREAANNLQPFDRIATGKACVERVASTRRILMPDGSIRVRYSSTQDPELHELPEGLIDPDVRTVSLLAGNKPLVRLHYYATHPQSYYGDGRACSDPPGLAREALQREEGVFQIYFTGCGGNVTAGKYNDGSPLARRELTARLLVGFQAAISASESQPLNRVSWRRLGLTLPLRDDGSFAEQYARATLANVDAPAAARLGAALNASYRRRAAQPLELSLLELNDVRIVHLPGEPFVEYQLRAQQLAPASFVCVAGYADGGPGYLCLEKSFAEGGYEPTASRVRPESEALIKAALGELLAPSQPR
ncbi:MAG: hypothetical protein K2Y37_10445 [Pirellulales bacterium]|nr:hypothetical protein [Pirellulales bacterium]